MFYIFSSLIFVEKLKIAAVITDKLKTNKHAYGLREYLLQHMLHVFVSLFVHLFLYLFRYLWISEIVAAGSGEWKAKNASGRNWEWVALLLLLYQKIDININKQIRWINKFNFYLYKVLITNMQKENLWPELRMIRDSAAVVSANKYLTLISINFNLDIRKDKCITNMFLKNL